MRLKGIQVYKISNAIALDIFYTLFSFISIKDEDTRMINTKTQEIVPLIEEVYYEDIN